MAQAQMQKPAATKEAATAPAGQPMAGNSGMQTPTEGGMKMTWWMWLIIAVVVIGAGVGIYFWLM
ncbi:MAG: hypothetical protein PVJ67_05760 [Candidatus Pacearchaeota archaeon]